MRLFNTAIFTAPQNWIFVAIVLFFVLLVFKHFSPKTEEE